MAIDVHIKIDGIPGESASAAHGKEIDVMSWSWGSSNTGSTHEGSGSGTGKVSIQDLSFTKYVDSATTKLLASNFAGDHIDKAVLTCSKAGGKEALDFLVITMENVMVASVSTGGGGMEERFTENVTLNFGKVKVEYKVQQKDGTGKPAGNAGWDIAANKAL
jgi:type VI secretion system secreted protein Hcp